VSYLPGLVALVTSGGAGLVTVGGLGGATSGASDMVDEVEAAMHCGMAVADLEVEKQLPLWCVCARVQFSRWSRFFSLMFPPRRQTPIAQPERQRDIVIVQSCWGNELRWRQDLKPTEKQATLMLAPDVLILSCQGEKLR